jgi:transposase-like protein
VFDPGIWWCIIFPDLEGCAMGQVLHASATTTEAIRRAIQHSQASLRELAKHYGINPKTVAKWKRRTSVSDLPTGPREPKSTVLTVEDEAVIVAFRRHTLLPLDDCFYSLQATIPHLTRSNLHRCLQRQGISRLPDVEGDKPSVHFVVIVQRRDVPVRSGDKPSGPRTPPNARGPAALAAAQNGIQSADRGATDCEIIFHSF